MYTPGHHHHNSDTWNILSPQRFLHGHAGFKELDGERLFQDGSCVQGRVLKLSCRNAARGVRAGQTLSRSTGASATQWTVPTAARRGPEPAGGALNDRSGRPEVLGVQRLQMADVPGTDAGGTCREIASAQGRKHFLIIRTDWDG